MNIVRILLFLAIVVGLILLQIFLSKRERRLPGLILPIIFFLLSLLYPLNIVGLPGMKIGELLLQMLVVWLLANIPTLIFLAIYFALQGNRRRKKQVEKMHIQDLD